MKTISQIAILGLVVAVVILSNSADAKLFKKKKWLLFPKLLPKLGKPEIEHTYVEHPKIVELIKHVPVVQKVEVIKPVEIIRTVTIPIEVIKEVEIIKTVPIIQEVIKEVQLPPSSSPL